MTPEEIKQLYKSGPEPVVELVLLIEKENLLLKEKNRLLEEKIYRLSRDSMTFHKPPSSDRLTKKKLVRPNAVRREEAQALKKAIQEKHAKSCLWKRSTKPSHIKPDKCEKCDILYSCETYSKPVERHQVWELPRIEPIIEEHVFFETECTCGHRTRAAIPQWIYSGVGENAQAAITYFTAVGKLTRRNLKLIFEQFFHFPISIGAIQK